MNEVRREGEREWGEADRKEKCHKMFGDRKR
jgi:hypothetical protein